MQGSNIFVAEEFLEGADVVAVLQEVGGKAVLQGMATDFLGNTCVLGGLFE